MKQLLMAAALSTLSLGISGCEPKRVVTAIPIPPERTDCQAATGKRPTLSPEYVIDWSKVGTVSEAQRQHDLFVDVLRGREKTVSTYVLSLEGDLFQCANDAAWIREWQAGTR